MFFLYQVLFGNPHNTVRYKTIPEDERETAADLKTIWDAEVGFLINIFIRSPKKEKTNNPLSIGWILAFYHFACYSLCSSN